MNQVPERYDEKRFPLCYETNNYSPRLAQFFERPLQNYPDLEVQVAAAASAGFQYIGIDRGSVENYYRSGKMTGQLRNTLERYGLRCLEIADISITDDEGATLAEARKVLEIAEALEAMFVQASVFGEMEPALACAQRVQALAKGAGTKLALEYQPFSLLNGIQSTLEFLKRGKLDETSMVVDTWHFFHGPDAWSDLEALPVELIAYIQFDDHRNLKTEDMLFETVNFRVLPGEGVFDLDRFCRTVRKKGYRRPISIEVLSSTMREWSPARFAEELYCTSRPYWL